VFDPGLPAVTPESELALHLPLRGAVLDRKVVALRAHASQTAGLLTEMGEDLFREWCAEECFVGLPSRPPWAAEPRRLPLHTGRQTSVGSRSLARIA
jgi:hypothetical protein